MRPLESKLTRIVLSLEIVAGADTIYRDLYLRRARRLLGPTLAEMEYRRLQKEREALDDVLRQIRSAVTHRAWPRVQSLVEQARPRRQALDAQRTALDLAARIYDAHDVPLAPFSPGLPGTIGPSPKELAQLKDRVVTALASLERDDGDCADFYAGRRSCLQAVALTPADPAEQAAAFDPSALETEAAHALDREDLDRLARLAERMLAARSQPAMTTICPPLGPDVDLTRAFPDDVRRRAHDLGLRTARVELDAECAEYLGCCCVWRPGFLAQPLAPETRANHDCTCGHVCPPGIEAPLRNTLDLLIVYPFVNSAGERYLPRLGAENVLVEDFPEGEAGLAAGQLPGLLGLTRRTAISRAELEAALLRRGPEILDDHLGLDPRDFRIVCVPFDVYSRLAPSNGWGQQPRCTHFDGYQVWKENRLRALVGGDVRYGGRHHLCSIGVDDERDEVILRLAVVRRERFAVTDRGLRAA